MNEHDDTSWRLRYRSTVTDEPTPALDEFILRAASRRAVQVRMLRGSVVVFGLAAVITLVLLAYPVSEPEARAASGYGLQEGTTRYYLMNAAGFTGPGSMEGMQ